MKICWDNLEKLQYNSKTGKFRKGSNEFLYRDSCKVCGEDYLTPKQHNSDFCSPSCSLKERKITWGEKISFSKKDKYKNDNNPNWKGGYAKNNLPSYELYAPQIEYVEQIRRCPDDENILEVKCTYCGKWYIPSLMSLKVRIKVLNGKQIGESRLYCSISCKKECPIYRKVKYSAEENNTKRYSREVQPELRQMVFERDNWECQKCGSTKSLQCHHVEGIRHDPLESADIDKCVTYCKKCHKKAHKKEGCGYQDMKCKAA